jgi:hypothetical protein
MCDFYLYNISNGKAHSNQFEIKTLINEIERTNMYNGKNRNQKNNNYDTE